MRCYLLKTGSILCWVHLLWRPARSNGKWTCFFSGASKFQFSLCSRVPVFVQLHSKSQHFYQGIYESKNLRTDFQMVHLKRVPPQCKYLTGKQIRIFHVKDIPVNVSYLKAYLKFSKRKSKVSPCKESRFLFVGLMPCQRIQIQRTGRSSHQILTQLNLEFQKLLSLVLDLEPLKSPLSNYFLLNCYAVIVHVLLLSLREIRVSALWSGLNEDVVVDSEGYTDLNVEEAPLWVVHLVPNDDVPSLLTKTMFSFLDACRTTQTTEQLLGKNYTVLQSPGNRVQLVWISLPWDLSLRDHRKPRIRTRSRPTDQRRPRLLSAITQTAVV